MVDRDTFYRLLGWAVPITGALPVAEELNSTQVSAASPLNATTVAAATEVRDHTSVKVGSIHSSADRSDVRLVTSIEELERIMPDLLQAPLVGLDTETTGLDPFYDTLRLVQLAVQGATFIVDCQQVNPLALTSLIEHARLLVGHNLKFDLKFLVHAGLPVPVGNRLFDTMLAAQLLGAGTGEGLLAQCGLGAVARRLLGIELDKSMQRTRWDGDLTSKQLSYAAQDASVLLPLATKMQKELEDDALNRVAALEMRALPAVAWLELAGAPFDTDAWADLSDKALRREIELVNELSGAALRPSGKEIGTADTLITDRVINWSSPPQVLRLLQKRGHRIERTDEATLRMIERDDPLVALLLEYREAKRRATTYGIEFVKHVHLSTKRIHADYLQVGAASGRMACRRPALQSVPRDRAYRACFRPKDGRCLVKADFSQIELRIAAELTGDSRMREAYEQGEDLHTVTAATVLGIREAEIRPEDRQQAKALNFGLLYGMGEKTLKQYAAEKYGVVLSDEQASAFRRLFFSTYAGIRRWHRAQRDGVTETRTMAERRRLGVERFTEKLNTPVQGTGADGLKAALALLWETRESCPGATPVLVVHDEIVIECPIERSEEAAAWLSVNMKRGMSAFLRHVPVKVDAKISRDWSGTD